MARKSRVRPEKIRERVQWILDEMDQTDPKIVRLAQWLAVEITRSDISLAIEGDIDALTKILNHTRSHGKVPETHRWNDLQVVADAIAWIKKTRVVTGSMTLQDA